MIRRLDYQNPKIQETIAQKAYSRKETSQLSRDEVTVLSSRARNGDIRARNRCVMSVYHFAYQRSINYLKNLPNNVSRRLNIDDLVNSSLMRLTKNFDKYNPQFKLTTYASRIFYNEIKREVDNSNLIKEPTWMHWSQHKYTVRSEEILKRAKTKVTLFTNQTNPNIKREDEDRLSPQEVISESDYKKHSKGREPKTQYEIAKETEMMGMVTKALKKLDERKQEIIRLRYFEGLSFREIGERFHLSAENTRMTHKKAIVEINKYISTEKPKGTSNHLETILEQEGITCLENN